MISKQKAHCKTQRQTRSPQDTHSDRPIEWKSNFSFKWTELQLVLSIINLFIPIGRSLISAKFRVYNSLLKRAITGRNKICRLNYVLNISCPLETFTRQTRQQLIFLLRAAIQLINIKLPSGIDISLCYDYPVITILLSLSSRNFPCHLQTGKRLVEFVKKDHEQENFRYALANLANTLFFLFDVSSHYH